jgi:hypothetical protein
VNETRIRNTWFNLFSSLFLLFNSFPFFFLLHPSLFIFTCFLAPLFPQIQFSLFISFFTFLSLKVQFWYTVINVKFIMKSLTASAHFALGIGSCEDDKNKEHSWHKSAFNLLSSLFLLLLIRSLPSFYLHPSLFVFHLFPCSFISSNQFFSFYFILYFFPSIIMMSVSYTVCFSSGE